MSSPPSFGDLRRHLPLLAGAIVLTQLPAAALLARGEWPSEGTVVLYLLASLIAAGGLYGLALALWRRLERIVALVEGYAEHGQIPDGAGSKGSIEAVRSSLKSLDRLVRNLESDAARDPLTGVYNRRAGAARLRDDVARSLRAKTPLSVAIFDLDDLKTINDEWGHAAGDEALRRLARTLHDETREGDWIARWGGDEFLIGLWGADYAAAVATTERVLRRLAESPLEFGGKSSDLGSSVGLAQLVLDDDVDALFARADEALLTAKRGRRKPVRP